MIDQINDRDRENIITCFVIGFVAIFIGVLIIIRTIFAIFDSLIVLFLIALGLLVVEVVRQGIVNDFYDNEKSRGDL